jgi:hypothetical protein
LGELRRYWPQACPIVGTRMPSLTRMPNLIGMPSLT